MRNYIASYEYHRSQLKASPRKKPTEIQTYEVIIQIHATILPSPHGGDSSRVQLECRFARLRYDGCDELDMLVADITIMT